MFESAKLIIELVEVVLVLAFFNVALNLLDVSCLAKTVLVVVEEPYGIPYCKLLAAGMQV